MKNILFAYTVLMLLIVVSCIKKEEPTSSWHKDIFRCKVNGVEWTPKCLSDPLFGCDAVDCLYYGDSKSISLRAIRDNYHENINQSMRIFKYGSQIGDNLLQYTSEEYKDWNKPSGCRFHDMDTTSVRRLTLLEVDTVNFLIKGTFEFTAINECQDTMKITDGFFHVNFRF